MTSPLPRDEAARLAALERYRILDTPHEPAWDDLARLAAFVCGAPLSVVNFIAGDRQWPKAAGGREGEAGVDLRLPREHSFCAHTVALGALLEIADATQDPRFAANPLVLAEPPLRFYAGAPITTPDGHTVGSVCVVDHVPRTLTTEQREALLALGRQAARELELRQHVALLEHEILERAATEEALFEREEQLRLFIDHTPLAVAMFDREMRYLLVSDSWLQLSHLTRDAVADRTFYETHPDLPERWREIHQRVLGGEIASAESDPYPRADGRVQRIRWECRPWRTASGMVGGLVLFVEDVTEQHRAAVALEQSEARNRRLAEATLDAVAIVQDGRIVDVNGRFCEMFGRAEPDVRGRSPAEFAAPAARAVVEARVRDGDEGTYTAMCVRADGSSFPAEISSRDYTFEGRPARVSVLRDITERHEIDRLKNEFVSTVSHELRTPLTSIRGSLGLIEGGVAGEVSPRARELTRIARSNADRLIRLINDILDLEKMEAGRLELTVVPLDPSGVVTTTLEGIQGMAEQRRVRLIARLGSHDRFLGDRDRVVQVLTNLVSNAIKFSPEKGDVTVRTARGDRPGTIRFCIEDAGPGIPPEKLPRLFRKFSQLDASDSRARGGTGLGLAISRTIVEQLGGRIGVESRPGELTTFWFELPLVALARRTPAHGLTAIAPGALPAMVEIEDAAPYSVLIVEDDRDLADVLGILLAHEGFDVDTAATLGEARAALQRRVPSVMLVDVALPDGDGLVLREEPRARDVPIIVLSGHDPLGARLPDAVRQWLLKPCDERELFGAVRRAVRHAGRPRVLVVDADAAARAARLAQLDAWEVECAEAGDAASALAIADEFAPDLMILDPALPDDTGGALVARLRLGPARSTPMLVLADRELGPVERRALHLGPTLHMVKHAAGAEAIEEALLTLLYAFEISTSPA